MNIYCHPSDREVDLFSSSKGQVEHFSRKTDCFDDFDANFGPQQTSDPKILFSYLTNHVSVLLIHQ